MTRPMLVKLVLLLSMSCTALNAFATKQYVFNPKDSRHALFVPNGKGPYPAILLLHASTGVEKVNHDWAKRLKAAGYVVYLIDSFKPRGWYDRKSVGWDMATTAQLSDVVPAYHYLASLPVVDGNRIGILGFSMGGFDVLRVMEHDTATLEEYQKLPFKAAASFYGVCKRLPEHAVLRGATTLFIGDGDDRATINECKDLIIRSAGINKNIAIKTYQNALHGFDNYEFPLNKEVIDERGERYHIGYNEAARVQSLKDLPAFFNRYLQ